MSKFAIERLPRLSYLRSTKIRTGRFLDGLAVVGTTLGSQEDRAHQLSIDETNGVVTYRRKAINVDCQALGSRDVHLSGIEEIARDEIASKALAYIAGAVAVEADYGWKHAFRLDELVFLRNQPQLQAQTLATA